MEQRSIFGEREDDADAALTGLVDELIDQGMSPDEVASRLEEAIPGALPEGGRIFLEGLKEHAPEMLEDRLALRARFSRRLQKRWGHPFRLLRMLIEAARESGEERNREHRPAAAQENDLVFEALIRLHARGCLVAEECSWLMEGGFASGAHSRWRTLHELATVSFFIQQEGREVAERYLLHHVAESCAAAEQYQQHCAALGQEPFTEDELEEQGFEGGAIGLLRCCHTGR